MTKQTVFLTAVLILFLGSTAWAAATSTQVVGYSVAAINEIAVSGDPGIMTITGATAGSEPSPVTDSTTTYSITTNKSAKKITGQITVGGAMPTGTTLEIELDATGVGTAGGKKTLTAASAVDLVTAITTKAVASKTITYTFTPTIAAGEISGSRTVTLTVSS